MDYYTPQSFMNAGLPKVTTIPSGNEVIQEESKLSVTQTDTPVSSSTISEYQTSNISSSANTNTTTNTNTLINTTSTAAVPSGIEEVLSGTSHAPYTRNHFAQYLLQRHCLENLEFYLEIEKFYQLSSIIEKEYNWKYLYNSFIEPDSPKEINLPASIRDHFAPHLIPSSQYLQAASKVVFGYLHEAYVAFISSTEQAQNDSQQQQQHHQHQQHQNEQRHNLQQSKQNTYSHHSQMPILQPGSTGSMGGPGSSLSSRCISPLSPSISNTTQLQRPANDDTDLPFDMSSDDDDNDDHHSNDNDFTMEDEEDVSSSIQQDQQRSRTTSHAGQHHQSQPQQTAHLGISIDNSGRNSSVSSSHSSSSGNNKLNSFVGSFKNGDSNWKKAAKKFKWRRSSYSSSE